MMVQGLGVLREQTTRFIAEFPTEVVLTRYARTPDGAGGQTESSSTLPPQTMRLVTKNPSSAIETRTVSGEVVMPEWTIVAEHDADIKDGDSFQFNGRRCEVIFAYGIGDYEMRAEVARRG